MSKMIYDFNKGEYIFINTSGKLGRDSEGHMMMKMTGNMAMDLESGDIHFVSGWDDDEDDW